MLRGIDFKHGNEVQLHFSTGKFRVGSSQTIQSMFKAYLSPMQAISVRRVRLPPLSGGGVVYYEVTGEMPDFVLELIDEFAQGGSPSGHLTSSEQ